LWRTLWLVMYAVASVIHLTAVTFPSVRLVGQHSGIRATHRDLDEVAAE